MGTPSGCGAARLRPSRKNQFSASFQVAPSAISPRRSASETNPRALHAHLQPVAQAIVQVTLDRLRVRAAGPAVQFELVEHFPPIREDDLRRSAVSVPESNNKGWEMGQWLVGLASDRVFGFDGGHDHRGVRSKCPDACSFLLGSGTRKSDAWVPSGSIVELTATMQRGCIGNGRPSGKQVSGLINTSKRMGYAYRGMPDFVELNLILPFCRVAV